jgi:hypothetical protein
MVLIAIVSPTVSTTTAALNTVDPAWRLLASLPDLDGSWSEISWRWSRNRYCRLGLISARKTVGGSQRPRRHAKWGDCQLDCQAGGL